MKVDEFVAEVREMCKMRETGGFCCMMERAIIKDRIPRLLSIIERQRAALNRIADTEIPCGTVHIESDLSVCDGIKDIARKALEEV